MVLNLSGTYVRLICLSASVRACSVVAPLSRQIGLPATPARLVMPEATGTITPTPSWNTTGAKLIALPPGASRPRVTVELRESRSISPLATAGKRWVAVTLRKSTLSPEPSRAAATARQTSTSNP